MPVVSKVMKKLGYKGYVLTGLALRRSWKEL